MRLRSGSLGIGQGTFYSRKTAAILAAAAATGLVSASVAQASPVYNGSALLISGAQLSSVATGLNASGEAVGTANNASGNSEPFAYVYPGPIVNIGAHGDQVAVITDDFPSVNASGQVTGSYSVATHEHAFSYKTSTDTITDISTIGDSAADSAGGFTSVGVGINNSGQIAFNDSNGKAFLYTPAATVKSLGSLGGSTQAVALNNSGQVIGTSSNGSVQHAFLSYPGSANPEDITPTDTNPSNTVAENDPSGGNASGVVVGTHTPVATGLLTAFWYQDTTGPGTDTVKDLSLGGDYQGNLSVNAAGKIIGTSDVAGDTTEHGFYFDTNGMAVSPTDIGSFDGPTGSSSAVAINASGEVTGDSSVEMSASTHAYRWTLGGGMVDLGTLDPTDDYSDATAINDSGDIVGDSLISPIATDAFIYTPTGGMVDLNSLMPSAFQSAYTLTGATAINNAGDILAVGYENSDMSESQFAFLITPVPEPASLLTLTAAAGLLGLRRRRRAAR